VLERIPFLKEAAEIVLSHQECYDGSGYPRGLKGDQIPLGARIFAVADTLDAMISDRPYRKALPIATAREEISEIFRVNNSIRRSSKYFLSHPDQLWIDLHDKVGDPFQLHKVGQRPEFAPVSAAALRRLLSPVPFVITAGPSNIDSNNFIPAAKSSSGVMRLRTTKNPSCWENRRNGPGACTRSLDSSNSRARSSSERVAGIRKHHVPARFDFEARADTLAVPVGDPVRADLLRTRDHNLGLKFLAPLIEEGGEARIARAHSSKDTYPRLFPAARCARAFSSCGPLVQSATPLSFGASRRSWISRSS
jgi:hypothetical protein